MARPRYEANDYRMTIRPHLGIGWQTTIDQADREVTMQLRLFCVSLPIKRKIPYSQVVGVASICREAWWSRIPDGHFYPELTQEHTPMPTRGWRNDILMTLRGGKTVKIETVTSLDVAREIEQELRQMIGLPEFH